MRKIRVPQVNKLESAVARDFRGGLNTFDSPLNLDTKYLTDVSNLRPDSNGRLTVRYGVTPFADVAIDVNEDVGVNSIVGMEYYAGAIIAVGANGNIVSIDASGVVTLRWDTAIAAALPGAPSGWTDPITYASFTQFAGQLIIFNGVDKPVTMDELFAVTYVAEPIGGSNTNTPRAKYCMTFDGHLIAAVTPTDSYTLYISSQGVTAFDPDAGDGTNFDTSIYVDRGVPIITGMSVYNDRLMVFFQETILAIQLLRDPGNNVSVIVTDTISGYGGVAHKAIVPLGDDMLFLDGNGVSNIRRSSLGTTFTPTSASSLLSVDIQKALAKFSNTTLTTNLFAIHGRIAKEIMFFIPKDPTVIDGTDNDVFVYVYDKAQKYTAWTKYADMPFRAACRTTDGRVFFGSGSAVRYYRNAYEPSYTDVGAGDVVEQNWDDGDAWDDGTGWLTDQVGEPINFMMRMPYADMDMPLNNKQSKYIAMHTEGRATFTVSMYVDEFSEPSLQMDFLKETIPEAGAYARRPVSNEQLYAWPQKFMRMYLEINGQTGSRFAIIAVGMLYLKGSVRR